MKNKSCFFCSGDFTNPASPICLPLAICHDCLAEARIDLGQPTTVCTCGGGNQLPPVKLNGTRFYLCENGLTPALFGQLAADLISTLDFVNAPSLYGSQANFFLISKLSEERLSH